MFDLCSVTYTRDPNSDKRGKWASFLAPLPGKKIDCPGDRKKYLSLAKNSMFGDEKVED